MTKKSGKPLWTKEKERVYRAAMRWFKDYADTSSAAMEGTWGHNLVRVHRACAAAKGKRRE